MNSYFFSKEEGVFMHIAICDDNVADRKQMERLLSRESDRRIPTTGNLYIDSFGNANALLSATLTYDAYYIDICKTEGVSGMSVVTALTIKGIHSPIIMCCSDVNYREQDFPENILFLDKPIKVPELSASIDHALHIRNQAPDLIELRENERTHYVTEPEIIYAVEDGFYLEFTLTENRHVRIATSALNFYSQVENYPEFLVPSEKVILNCRYISKMGFRKVTMTDGTKFHVPGSCMAYAKKMLSKLTSSS